MPRRLEEREVAREGRRPRDCNFFLIGQAKLLIFKSHQCKNAGEDIW